MKAAKAFEIRDHRQPTRSRVLMIERDGVVQVAEDGPAAATREAAGQIPTPHRALERRRRLIAQRLGRMVSRIGDTAQRGRRGRQPANLLGVDHPVALQVARLLALAVHGVLTGDHVDDDLDPTAIADRAGRRGWWGSRVARSHASARGPGSTRPSASARR